jgi:hypothetical protein
MSPDGKLSPAEYMERAREEALVFADRMKWGALKGEAVLGTP